MPNLDPIEIRLFNHVIREGCPMNTLVNTGVLAEEWVNTYLALLKEAEQKWRQQPSWPRELVTAIHTASWYLHIRYQSWSANGARNKTTERLLGKVRTPSESFLLSPVVFIPNL